MSQITGCTMVRGKSHRLRQREKKRKRCEEEGGERKGVEMVAGGGKNFMPGMCVLADIQKYQKSSDLLIRRWPFARCCLKYTLMQYIISKTFYHFLVMFLTLKVISNLYSIYVIFPIICRLNN